MIKTVQIEERRVICDICQKSWYKEGTIPMPEGWCLVNIGGPQMDFCPDCAKKLKTVLNRGEVFDGKC